MTCPNCASLNQAGTNFCIKCGTALPTPVVPPFDATPNSSSKTSDGIVFISILAMTVIALISAIMRFVIDEWYRPPAQYFFILFGFISALIPLALAFVIKNKTLKVIAIVAAIIYVLQNIYQSVQWILDMF